VKLTSSRVCVCVHVCVCVCKNIFASGGTGFFWNVTSCCVCVCVCLYVRVLGIRACGVNDSGFEAGILLCVCASGLVCLYVY